MRKLRNQPLLQTNGDAHGEAERLQAILFGKIDRMKRVQDSLSIPVNLGHSRQFLFFCERTYNRRTFKDSMGKIEFGVVKTFEHVFVMAPDKELQKLPQGCKVVRKCSNVEKSRLVRKSITLEDFFEKHALPFPIGYEYVPTSIKKPYTIVTKRKQVYCVDSKEGIVSLYLKKENVEEYAMLTDDEVCRIDVVSIRRGMTTGSKFKEFEDLENQPEYEILPDIFPQPGENDTLLKDMPPGLQNMLPSPAVSQRNYVPMARGRSLPPEPMARGRSTSPEPNGRRRSLPPEPMGRRSSLPPAVSPSGSIARRGSPSLEPDVEQELRQEIERGARSNPVSHSKPGTQQITFQELNAKMAETYNYEEIMNSTTIDIVGIYLKGQKLLYVEAKVYCEQYLYALMIPAIFITALCSILSLILREYSAGPLVVSSLTAVNSVILSLVTYLKLDAKAEAHKTTAYSFEKLQSFCEFSSGRLLFKDVTVSPMKLIEQIGNEVKDIKDKNQFVLPQYIRHRFPILYSTNVFAEVKRIQNDEIILINTLKTIINDGYQILADLQTKGLPSSSDLEANSKKQKKAFDAIIKFRERYIDIDDCFKTEIEENIVAYKNQWTCFTWLKT